MTPLYPDERAYPSLDQAASISPSGPAEALSNSTFSISIEQVGVTVELAEAAVHQARIELTEADVIIGSTAAIAGVVSVAAVGDAPSVYAAVRLFVVMVTLIEAPGSGKVVALGPTSVASAALFTNCIDFTLET